MIKILCLLFTCSFLFSHDLNIIKDILPANCVILDCGANDGGSSHELAKKFPMATILAVEADPNIYDALAASVKNSDRILPFNLALSDKNGSISFFPNTLDSKSNKQGSLLPASEKNWYWKYAKVSPQPITVEAKTLDDFCFDNGITELHFLFLDMQGGEYQMLKHSKQALKSTIAIYTEVLFEEIYKNCPLYKDYKKLLNDLGFEEKQLWKRHKSWGDALFIRKEFL